MRPHCSRTLCRYTATTLQKVGASMEGSIEIALFLVPPAVVLVWTIRTAPFSRGWWRAVAFLSAGLALAALALAACAVFVPVVSALNEALVLPYLALTFASCFLAALLIVIRGLRVGAASSARP